MAMSLEERAREIAMEMFGDDWPNAVERLEQFARQVLEDAAKHFEKYGGGSGNEIAAAIRALGRKA
jgi:hypothetical protein